jgi:hypothetical protein
MSRLFNRVRKLALLGILHGGLLIPGRLLAQPHDHSHATDAAGHSHAGDHEGHNHGGEVLAYRLPQGKTMHFKETGVAAQHLAAVKQLGCEAQQVADAEHTDVVYRCADWRTMTLASHELAVQWEGWLKEAGFDVFHGHVSPEYLQGPEVVEYRLQEWRTLHAEGPQVAQLPPLIERLKAIGCEVEQDPHEGHADVRYRCPIWTEVHLANHATAEQWLAWFKAQGFETKHED